MGRRKKVVVEQTMDDMSGLIDVSNLPEGEADNSIEERINDDTDKSENADSYKEDLADIDRIIAEETDSKKRGRKTKEEKAKAAIVIPGSLFVRMHNMVASNGVAALDTWLTKRNPLTPELLSMDEKTIQELVPVAELAMKEMKIEENPIAAFYIMFGAGMLSNYVTLKALIKNAEKENPDFNINDLGKTKK